MMLCFVTTGPLGFADETLAPWCRDELFYPLPPAAITPTPPAESLLTLYLWRM